MRKALNLMGFLITLSLLWQGCTGSGGTESAWMPRILSDTGTYLPDFSYAGYYRGETPLPEATATIRVTDFGVIPDDGKDDSEAILKAVAAAQRQTGTAVVEFPPGEIILKKILFIDRSDVILQGAGSGPDGTRLVFPLPMKDLPLPEEMVELQEYLQRNNKRLKSGEPFSPFSWTGGFIWTRVPQKRIYPYLPEKDRPEATICAIQDGKRGEHCFTADHPGDLQPGRLVKILWFNREGAQSTLLRHLYGEDNLVIGERHWKFPDRPLIQQMVTIREVQGNRVCIKEPLLHDLRPEWGTVVAPAELLTGVGIEHLRIQFPAVPYAGHHLEHGYNAIYLTSVAHSWVRDVEIENADNAFLSDEAAFVTIDGLAVSGRKGHYGIHFGKTNHMLAKNCTIAAPMEHSISFNTFAKAGVYSNVDILQTPSLDQHCGTNHQNLFDNIRVRVASAEQDLFKHGGAGYWKPTHGKYNVFWNIELQLQPTDPPVDTLRIKEINDGLGAILVGVSGNVPIDLKYGPAAYMEGLNRANIAVPSLYAHQLNRRLAGKSNLQ